MADSDVASFIALIHAGEVETIRTRLIATPSLALERVSDGICVRSMMHYATDWPGKRPNVGATIRLLHEYGADPNARAEGPHTETPLHWAASSDDVAAVDALLEVGADIEADGAVIGGLSPLADAVAFRQWRAAQSLVAAGAQVMFWQAAGLGMIDVVREQVAEQSAHDVTNAFWVAASGGRLDVARLLLDAGADQTWVGHDDMTARDVAAGEGYVEVAAWIESVGG